MTRCQWFMLVFFFKQKTAYELRISDWSSDVCSSDLGAALSGIAAENLEGGSGITSRTIASLEHGWARDRDRLTSRDVLVVDEAGMIGTRQLQRVLSEAADAGAKVVLVGDTQIGRASCRDRVCRYV